MPQDVVAVVLDGADWRTTGKLEVPANVRLVVLPPYTPELNPAERLWHLMREATSNKTFANLDELEAGWCERCLQLEAQPEVIASTTSYHGYQRQTNAQA